MTSVALMTASTLSPAFMSNSSTASLDMIAVTTTGLSILILTFAVTTPLSTSWTIPLSRFRALILQPSYTLLASFLQAW